MGLTSLKFYSKKYIEITPCPLQNSFPPVSHTCQSSSSTLRCTPGRLLLESSGTPSSRPFYGLHIRKSGPLDHPLELGEQEKNHKGPSLRNTGVAPEFARSSPPETVGCSGHCEQEHCHGGAPRHCSPTDPSSSPRLIS